MEIFKFKEYRKRKALKKLDGLIRQTLIPAKYLDVEDYIKKTKNIIEISINLGEPSKSKTVDDEKIIDEKRDKDIINAVKACKLLGCDLNKDGKNYLYELAKGTRNDNFFGSIKALVDAGVKVDEPCANLGLTPLMILSDKPRNNIQSVNLVEKAISKKKEQINSLVELKQKSR